MKSTSISLLLRVAIVFALLGGLFDTFWKISTGTLFRWGWGSWAAMLIADLAMIAWAWSIRHRLPKKILVDGKLTVQRAAAPLAPVVAARTAALALAGSRTGAAVGGFYLGCALYARFESPLAVHHSTVSLATSLTSVVMIIISLWIEKHCLLPPDSGIESEESANS